MPQSKLYSAYRAAGAASGKYRASLYDIANIGYEMEADVGIEKFRGQEKVEAWDTLSEAIGLVDTAVQSVQAERQHQELVGSKKGITPTQKPFYGERAGLDWGDIFGEKSIFKGKPTTPTTPKLPSVGPTAKMKKMMDVYKQKVNKPGQAPGWDPTKESWYQEEFGEELGWVGGKTGWSR